MPGKQSSGLPLTPTSKQAASKEINETNLDVGHSSKLAQK